MSEITTQSPEMMQTKSEHGFSKVYTLSNDEPYRGNADHVILVWDVGSEFQIIPAEQYRRAHFDGDTTDFVICENPNIQKSQLGDKAVVYHFSGNGNGYSGR